MASSSAAVASSSSSDTTAPPPSAAAGGASSVAISQLGHVHFDGAEFLRILTAGEFSETDAKRWIDNHFYLTLQISALYVTVVFGTKWLMRDRQPFNLFVPLNAWNAFLALFSIAGALSLTPEFFTAIWRDGFQDSYCKVSTFTSGRNGYWVWLFIVSKMFELVDTVFLVLRKRPLMFLHWYHHILTMVYAFFSYPLSPGFNRWGIYLNFVVHAFMYSYYFLRSMKIRVSGTVAKFITTIQIWQFIISVTILIHLGYLIFVRQVECDFDHRVFALAVFMDVSYLILFVNFFLNAYIFGGGKSKYRNAAAANGKTVNGINRTAKANGAETTANGTAQKLE